MRRLVRLLALLALIAGAAPAATVARADASPIPPGCTTGTLPHGALSLFCIPSSGWNGDLVVYAHGYVPVTEPIAFQQLTLPNSTTSLPGLVESLGFAFATTSYRENGLAILTGADDVRELVAAYRAAHGTPKHTYLVGASEGGLITTLLTERSPDLFSGALAACGPIGDFPSQINYIGDFRVLFDYFFPGVIPGSPIDVPRFVIDNWHQVYVPAITRAIQANPAAAQQLIATSKAAIDPADPSTIATTAVDVLSYSVLGANDAARKLGGNPFDNHVRWYWGSSNDLLLNIAVKRFTASPVAQARMLSYQTSGNVTIPLITLHTTGDDVIPFWNEVIYALKVRTSGLGSLVELPVFRYRHCNFTEGDLLTAFGLLVFEASTQAVPGAAPARTAQEAPGAFDRARREALPPPGSQDR